MIKKILCLGLLFTGFNVFSQAFVALYPFSAVTSTSGATDPTPTPTAVGVSFGAFSAAGVSANSGAASRFSFTSWGTGATDAIDTYSTMTGAIDLNKYYQAVISPSVSYGVTLTKIDMDVRRSSTGIRNWSARSSADGYTTNIPIAVIGTQTVINVLAGNIFFWALDGASTTVDQKGGVVMPSAAAFTNFLNPLTIRIYAWNSEGGAGTFSIDSVKFTGTATLGAGVAEITHDLNAGFKLYPNPSQDGILTLETKHINYSKIEIINLLGSIVAIENKDLNVSEKIKLNLNTLPSGTYFVRVTEGDKIYTERLFITK